MELAAAILLWLYRYARPLGAERYVLTKQHALHSAVRPAARHKTIPDDPAALAALSSSANFRPGTSLIVCKPDAFRSNQRSGCGEIFSVCARVFTNRMANVVNQTRLVRDKRQPGFEIKATTSRSDFT